MEHLNKDIIKPIIEVTHMAITFDKWDSLDACPHANPEFEGTGNIRDFYYNPYYFDKSKRAEWLVGKDATKMKEAIEYWKDSSKLYYRGELDINELTHHKEAFLFCANMLARTFRN